MTIGKRISGLRKERGFSQEYVAGQVDVSRQAVSKWESDQTAPDTNNLIRLAELFGVSVEYLATGKQPEPPAAPPEPNPPAAPWAREVRTQRILGFIFVAAGLLALVLGLLFPQAQVALLTAAVWLLVIGALCLTVKEHIGRAIGIALAVLILIPLLLLSVFRVKTNPTVVVAESSEIGTEVFPEQ